MRFNWHADLFVINPSRVLTRHKNDQATESTDRTTKMTEVLFF